MSKAWPTVRLGEVLRRTDEVAAPDALTEYREVTVRLWGNGVIERGRVLGADVNGRRYVARKDQFIASRIDARNGAMGIVPDFLDGALVTNDFPLFSVVGERLLVHFLGWLCRTPGFVELCMRASEGTTNRVRLKEDRFLALDIPLPPLSEQRRIVGRIEALAAEIEAARRLRAAAVEEGEGLLASQVTRLLNVNKASWGNHPLLDVCDFEGGSQPPKSTFTYEPTPGYVRFLQIRDFTSDDHLTYIPHSPRNSMVAPHEVLVGRYGASLGKILRGKSGAYNVAMCKAVPRRSDLNLDFLAVFLRHGAFQERLAEISRSAQAGFNKSDIKEVNIAIPPISDQRRIVAELDALHAEVDKLKALQAETGVELDALLPSILDRAFKGGL